MNFLKILLILQTTFFLAQVNLGYSQNIISGLPSSVKVHKVHTNVYEMEADSSQIVYAFADKFVYTRGNTVSIKGENTQISYSYSSKPQHIITANGDLYIFQNNKVDIIHLASNPIKSDSIFLFAGPSAGLKHPGALCLSARGQVYLSHSKYLWQLTPTITKLDSSERGIQIISSWPYLTYTRGGDDMFSLVESDPITFISSAYSNQPFSSGILILLFFILLALGVIVLYSWRRYLHAKVRYKLESLINARTEELVKEKEKTDNLLARLLPKETASQLKEKGRVNTQRFQVVTVLFCDIEGFTRITDETNPEVLIDQLDRFFLYFDTVVDKYKIEKIKTIGDAYMCAGGIPEKNRTNPVEVVLAALEMMSYMRSIAIQNDQHQSIWELRIGIDTGPVIAGVVGRNKLSYDIWGSTVNTASRMESSGEAGHINISGNTYMLVSDYFDCTYRGKMPVKNKGDIEMYFVNGIKPDLSANNLGIVPNEEFKIQLQLIRLGDLEDYVLEKLERGLPKTLYYHNLKHTVDVYTQVELIGRSENVTNEELLLLRTAALFHDAGHLIDYETHEEMAVKMIREILPEYYYTEKQIERISELIMCTKLPPNPKNLLEEIMCDADLDYLGRTDFIPVSNNLYRELHEHGKVGTLREWNQLQIKFIDKHSYFTKTARMLRNVNKQSQLDKLKDWIEKN